MRNQKHSFHVEKNLSRQGSKFKTEYFLGLNLKSEKNGYIVLLYVVHFSVPT